MADLRVRGVVLEVGNHQAELALALLGLHDVGPHVGVFRAAADLGHALELGVDLRRGAVLGAQLGALGQHMAEGVEVHVHVQLLRHLDEGPDGVLVVLLGDASGGVDVQVDVRQVLGADDLSLLVEVVRVPPVRLAEAHLDGLVAVLGPVDLGHLVQEALDKPGQVDGLGALLLEGDVGRLPGPDHGIGLGGRSHARDALQVPDRGGQLVQLVVAYHLDLHLDGLVDDVPLVDDVGGRGAAVLLDVDEDDAAGTHELA